MFFTGGVVWFVRGERVLYGGSSVVCTGGVVWFVRGE